MKGIRWMGCRKIKAMSYYFHKLDKPSLSTAKNHGRIKKWSKSPWKHKINVFIHNPCRSAASWTGPWRWTTSRWTPSTGSGTTTCWPTSSTGQHQHQPVMAFFSIFVSTVWNCTDTTRPQDDIILQSFYFYLDLVCPGKKSWLNEWAFSDCYHLASLDLKKISTAKDTQQ